mmetsp:Transcript_63826/g.152229  ORF Transcript_63826/g.152229 Transcript_63826/m.152229 type:complete len:227 (-) Transcript_63826:325-1005(-)
MAGGIGIGMVLDHGKGGGANGVTAGTPTCCGCGAISCSGSGRPGGGRATGLGARLRGGDAGLTRPTGKGRADGGAGVIRREPSGFPAEALLRVADDFCWSSFCSFLVLAFGLDATVALLCFFPFCSGGCSSSGSGCDCSSSGAGRSSASGSFVSAIRPNRVRRVGEARSCFTALRFCGDGDAKDAPRRFFGERLSAPEGDAGMGCNGVPLKRVRRLVFFAMNGADT